MSRASIYPEFSISWEWEPSEGIRSPELSATFARLEIWVGDNNVTLVEDKRSGSSRRAIYVSLYSLAEWIAFNWWFLQVHSRSDVSSRTVDPHHSVRSSGDGFLWPNLHILPEGRTTRLSWVPDKGFHDGALIRFLTQGNMRVDSDQVRLTLANFVSDVVSRLVEADVKGTALQDEWSSIVSLDHDERDFCLVSARLGIDPMGHDASHEEAILSAAESLPQELQTDFFDAVHPDSIGDALAWISNSIEIIEKDKVAPPSELTIARERLRTSTIPRYQEPWTTGWRQASAVRNVLSISPGERFDLDSVLRASTRPADEKVLQAIGIGGDDAADLVVLGRRFPPRTRRFTLARALWHVVSSDHAAFVVTASHTEAQRIERAFAAEILAPAQGIRDRIGDPADVQDEDIEEISNHFDVSTTVVEHQLANQIIGAAS